MNNFKQSVVLLSVVLLSTVAQAMTLKKVELPDQITVDGKTLILNGMGLRQVVRYGISFDVYVGGLYLEKKEQNSDTIINSSTLKKLVMVYLRSVDREDVYNAALSSYKESCQVSCDKVSEQFKPYGASLVSVREKTRMELTFYPDKVVLEIDRPNKVKKEFIDSAFSKNLLTVYINAVKPPTPEFRKGLLGMQ